MTGLNQRGFSAFLFLALIALLSAGIVGGSFYLRQTGNSIPATPSPQPSASTGSVNVVEPNSATPSASSVNPSDKFGPCPSGYVQYGVPLGCVKPEVIEKCQNQRGGCPICLASNTMIDSPAGEINVKDLKAGMIVWSVNKSGKKIAAKVLQVSSALAPREHKVIDLILADGREVFVSPSHPGTNSLAIADLTVGETYDNSQIISKNLVPYWDNKTYDLLPEGETGFYYADKILLGSTLKH